MCELISIRPVIYQALAICPGLEKKCNSSNNPSMEFHHGWYFTHRQREEGGKGKFFFPAASICAPDYGTFPGWANFSVLIPHFVSFYQHLPQTCCSAFFQNMEACSGSSVFPSPPGKAPRPQGQSCISCHLSIYLCHYFYLNMKKWQPWQKRCKFFCGQSCILCRYFSV